MNRGVSERSVQPSFTSHRQFSADPVLPGDVRFSRVELVSPRMTHLRPGRLALRFLAVSGVALATANCASNTATKFAATGNGVDPKYGVKASPRLYNEGDTIPKGGGRRYTGKPYVVAGQTYAPARTRRATSARVWPRGTAPPSTAG